MPTSDDRSLWLLDNDGVLNANRPGWGAAPRYGMAYFRGAGWKQCWAPTLMSRIRVLSRDVEIYLQGGSPCPQGARRDSAPDQWRNA